MIKKGFKMKVYPDKQQEYEKRHNQLWEEMREMLKEYGVVNYTIFLDSSSSDLYAYLEIEDETKWNESSKTGINKKWWEYMADIMETNPDYSPVTENLTIVFDL